MGVHKKTRKMRGNVSHGHGRVGKHRKHPGGRGKCGGLLHHRTLFERYHPDHFGKRGMKMFLEKKNKRYAPTITVEKIWSLVEKAGQLEQFTSSTDTVPVVNLSEFGIYKVLGTGSAPTRPIVVKARMFTPMAEEKIVSAGGQCVLTV